MPFLLYFHGPNIEAGGAVMKFLEQVLAFIIFFLFQGVIVLFGWIIAGTQTVFVGYLLKLLTLQKDLLAAQEREIDSLEQIVSLCTQSNELLEDRLETCESTKD